MTQRMSRRGMTIVSLAAAGLMWAGAAQADEIPVEVLAAPCAGCHGVEGSSMGPATPTIAGMSVDYFTYSMESYADGARPSTVMQRVAKGYSQDQFKQLAEYFAKQPFKRIEQPVDAALAKKGDALQRKYCADCHEQDGKVGDGTGVLAGQMLPYMEWSVADFRNGDREMERRQAREFRKLEAAEGDEGFAAILNFYASQQ